MCSGTVRAQVFGGGEPLLDAAVQLCVGAHLLAGFANGAVATAHDQPRRCQHVGEGTERQPPIDDGQHRNHAYDHGRCAHHTRDDPAEEVAHGGDITIDSLNHLARSVAAMELVVEAQHVAC